MADTKKSQHECNIELAKLIKSFHTAMLVTMREGGKHVSRPMSPLSNGNYGGQLWFSAERSSDCVAEIKQHPEVNVAFMDESGSRYVSASGRATQVDDQAKKDELWSPVMKAFFESKDDPNLTLIRVDVDSAEYWSGPSTLIGKGIYLAKSAFTDNHDSMTDHGTVTNPAA